VYIDLQSATWLLQDKNVCIKSILLLITINQIIIPDAGSGKLKNIDQQSRSIANCKMVSDADVAVKDKVVHAIAQTLCSVYAINFRLVEVLRHLFCSRIFSFTVHELF